MATPNLIIPRTGPDAVATCKASGRHTPECPVDEHDGFLGPYDTYQCPCWCHE